MEKNILILALIIIFIIVSILFSILLIFSILNQFKKKKFLDLSIRSLDNNSFLEFCPVCDKYVNVSIYNENRNYEDENFVFVYKGKGAYCPFCGEQLLNDYVIEYNQRQISDKIKKIETFNNRDINCVILSEKQIALKNGLEKLVCSIRHCEFSKNLFDLLKLYSDLIFDNFEDVQYFVINFEFSYLSSFLLDNTIKLLKEDYNCL